MAASTTTSRPGGRPPFIVLEGGEGVGKTTQAGLLSEWLVELKVPHAVEREPGGTEAGEAIRGIVLDHADLDLDPVSELFLILASRTEFVRSVARPRLADGRVLIADRFSLSTLAYQGYGRGIPLDIVRDGLRVATAGLEPDLNVLIDLPVEEAAERRSASGFMPDRIEAEGAGFMDRVRLGYLRLAADDPSVEMVDGSGSADDVHGKIVCLLRERFPETFDVHSVQETV